jgi:predicted CopG family antitoxin
MKTITLTDQAYERLKSWKSGRESFSDVVLRTVPKRGTFGDLDETFKGFSRPFEEQARIVQETIASKIRPVGDER